MTSTLVETLKSHWPRVDWPMLSIVSTVVWARLEKAQSELYSDLNGDSIYKPFDALNRQTADIKISRSDIWYEYKFRGWAASISVTYAGSSGQRFLSNLSTYVNCYEPLRLGVDFKLMHFDAKVLKLGCTNLSSFGMNPVLAASLAWLCMQDTSRFVLSPQFKETS